MNGNTNNGTNSSENSSRILYPLLFQRWDEIAFLAVVPPEIRHNQNTGTKRLSYSVTPLFNQDGSLLSDERGRKAANTPIPLTEIQTCLRHLLNAENGQAPLETRSKAIRSENFAVSSAQKRAVETTYKAFAVSAMLDTPLPIALAGWQIEMKDFDEKKRMDWWVKSETDTEDGFPRRRWEFSPAAPFYHTAPPLLMVAVWQGKNEPGFVTVCALSEEAANSLPTLLGKKAATDRK